MKSYFNKTAKVLAIILLTCSSISQLFSQDMNLYLVKENVETVVRNSELIISDPLNISALNSFPDYKNIDNEFTENQVGILNNVKLSLITDITPNSKFLTLPLSYSWKDFTFSGTIPFYLSRKMTYSHGTEKGKGFGDMSLKVNYKKKLGDFRTEYNLNIKLPTGNEANQVNGYLVPLGTGSTDLMGQGILIYKKNKSVYYSNLTFRLNGKMERIAEITYPEDGGVETINYKVNNGNALMLNTSYSYRIWKYAVLVGGISGAFNNSGKMDRLHSYSVAKSDTIYKGLSADQNFIFVDLNPAVVLTYHDLQLSLSCKLPAYTKQNANSSVAGRKVGFYARFIYAIY